VREALGRTAREGHAAEGKLRDSDAMHGDRLDASDGPTGRQREPNGRGARLGGWKRTELTCLAATSLDRGRRWRLAAAIVGDALEHMAEGVAVAGTQAGDKERHADDERDQPGREPRHVGSISES